MIEGQHPSRRQKLYPPPPRLRRDGERDCRLAADLAPPGTGERLVIVQVGARTDLAAEECVTPHGLLPQRHVLGQDLEVDLGLIATKIFPVLAEQAAGNAVRR